MNQMPEAWPRLRIVPIREYATFCGSAVVLFILAIFAYKNQQPDIAWAIALGAGGFAYVSALRLRRKQVGAARRVLIVYWLVNGKNRVYCKIYGPWKCGPAIHVRQYDLPKPYKKWYAPSAQDQLVWMMYTNHKCGCPNRIREGSCPFHTSQTQRTN